MKKILPLSLLCVFVIVAILAMTPRKYTVVKPPIMGWSSWNNFHVDISDSIIRSQAHAMSQNGMKDVGYEYINIDDGYFGGRDEDGNMLFHPTRFPNGMSGVVRYIHQRGLKAGIYSDAGINTCGCRWNKDTISAGCGLYGHDSQDLSLFFSELKFDFIKVDWCGGRDLALDEETRYTEIYKYIKAINPDVVYNVCRWQFPGKWVIHIADSWRISGDISSNFKSITSIIDINADNWRYCGPGHYNDMDMLQVGRGMTYEEDKSHFTMWCAMVSPLLAGNDLTKMSEETRKILTNKKIIALNRDPLFYQARRIMQKGDMEIWAKPMKSVSSGEVAVVLFNRSANSSKIVFKPYDMAGLSNGSPYSMEDLWTNELYPASTENTRTFTVPSHGVVALMVKGKSAPYNLFQYK